MTDVIVKKYKVDGMHCVSCAMLIENELEDKGLVDEAVCEYAKSELILRSQKELDTAQVAKTIEKLGYTITPYAD